MTDTTTTALQQQIATSPLPVFVDIYSPQCGPCRSLLPVLEELSADFQGSVDFVKLNAVADGATVQACADLGIRGVPALLIFRNGTEKARRTGSASKTQLKAWIEESLKS